MKIQKQQLILILIAVFVVAATVFLSQSIDTNILYQTILINIVCGIVGSFLFIIFLLHFLRPKLKISPYICLLNDQYRIKIVNCSIYDAFDISFELHRVEPYHHHSGKSSARLHELKLLSQNMTHIVRNRKGNHKSDPYHLYARTIVAADLTRETFNVSGSYVELKITAKHGLTGLARTFTQKFENDCIRPDHKFCYGNNLETMSKDLA